MGEKGESKWKQITKAPSSFKGKILVGGWGLGLGERGVGGRMGETQTDLVGGGENQESIPQPVFELLLPLGDRHDNCVKEKVRRGGDFTTTKKETKGGGTDCSTQAGTNGTHQKIQSLVGTGKRKNPSLNIKTPVRRRPSETPLQCSPRGKKGL